MNKKLISFLAATAMIVTVSQESMALVGEAISNGNVAIEQEKDQSDAIVEDEAADSQGVPEANKVEDTQVSDTNVVEVKSWAELETAITNASNGDTIRINGDIDKISTDKAITISGKTIKIVAQKDDGSGIKITRDSKQSTNGEFIIEGNAGLTLEGDLTIEAHDYQNDGMLTHANFIKVEKGGNLNITDCEITAHTDDDYNNNNQGNFGLILCEGNIIINDGAKISGYTVNKSGGDELAAVVVKGLGATLTMTGGEISGNYNKYTSPIDGASIQVRDGARFTMNGGSIINNGKIMKDGKLSEDNCIYGSGVYVEGGGSTFIMDGGIISNNFGFEGVGIYSKGEGTGKNELAIIEINGGKINENKLYNKDKYGNLGGGICAKYTDLKIKGKDENNKVIISKNGVENELFGEYRFIQSHGGGVYAEDSDVEIINTEISGNQVDGGNGMLGGAGVYISKSNVVIKNTEIKKNQAGKYKSVNGGGIYVQDESNVYLENVLISENEVAPNSKPNEYDRGKGGGIFVSGNNAELSINNCSILNNRASYIGAGICIYGGKVKLNGSNDKYTEIKDNIILDANNKTNYSEGIYIKTGAKLEIEGNTLINKNNDVYLEQDAFINVTNKLNKVNGTSPISITSAEENIEDENTEGTKVVEYSEVAGGEAEALNATLGKYFIPSKYAINKDLKIGQSQKTKNVLTYVEKLPENTPPVINASDKEIFVGDNFDPLKDVTATDTEDGTIPLTKNNIKENTVDISKPGEYKITYSVTDSVGATTEKTIKVTVKSKSTGGGGGTIVTPPTEKEPDRIEGDDRIETSVETSKDLYPSGTNAVVLANAERYTDVLTADPFAIQEKASALLTYKYELPEKTLKEIERLGAKKIYISGGYDAVSKKVVDELAAKGYEIFRFDGVDRYDTARKIAIKIREKGNTNAAELASGENYPDALCMTPLAVKDHAPILLTKKDSIPKYTKQALAEWDIENIKIGGLDQAVSSEVEKQLKAGFEIEKNNKKDSNVYDGAKAVKRIGGEDRYETSAKLAAESYPESKLSVYATGEDFPDALIAGNYAGRKEAPVLLVKRDTLPEVVEKYTTDSKIEKATVIGGVNAVSDKVFNLIKAAINK